MKKTFTVSPRILSHFGEELIKNENIALLELVKNSYDACASYCRVEFITDKIGHLIGLEITDDGTGMDLEIIEKVWLNIGTDYKNTGPIKHSGCERHPLGEKGIGRFGIHKLGNSISLISKKNNYKEVSLSIDWKHLNKAKQIDDFTIEVIENKTPKYFVVGHGTRISIQNLKSNWNRRQIREVHRGLTSLNSPFSENKDSFHIEIKATKDLFENLPDFEQIKDSALYFGHCRMEGDKIVKFEYKFKPWETLAKIDRGRSKTKKQLIQEELTIIDPSKDKNIINLDYYKIGPIDFNIIIFEKDAQIFNYVNLEKKSITEYLKSNGGIRVYRDGIRVYDYGEQDNDWLGIDLRRVSKVGGRISNNIVLGSVRINRQDSSGLHEKTNREGFIENDTYNAFLHAINYALSIFVKERNIDKQKLTTLYKKHKVIEPVLSDLDEIIKIVEEKLQSNETKDELLFYLERVGKQYKEVKEILIKSANAGLNFSIVVHQIEKMIADLTGSIIRKDIEKAIHISSMLENIIRGYMAMIKKSSIKRTNLSNIVNISLENYEFRFSDHQIDVVSNHNEINLEGFLPEAESISVLTNLLDNSIYWLSYARKYSRKISVFITDQIDNFNSIIVSDNGPGFNIPVDMATEPFITGKPHNIGSGLGLHIANEMMNAMKGRLLFLDKNDIKVPNTIEKNKITQAIVALCFRKER
jgi:signal transduction histidine kinase